MGFFNMFITCEVIPILGTEKTNKNLREYYIFEPTDVVPSSLQQPPADTTAQGSTNGDHVTAEGGKATSKPKKNRKLSSRLDEKLTLDQKVKKHSTPSERRGVVAPRLWNTKKIKKH